MSTVDLHVHSNYSNDGEFNPKQLIDMCIERDVKVMAITDLNSVEGISEALEYAKQKDIKVIPGIEIDCVFDDKHLNLLGYYIDHEHPGFLKLKETIIKMEQKNFKKKTALIKKLGLYINKENIIEGGKNSIISDLMLAKWIIDEKENANNDLIKPYLKHGIKSDNPYANFCDDYFSLSKPAYVAKEYIPLKKAINLIKKANGVSVLAHPGISIGKDENLLKAIIDQGVLGIEVFTSHHTQDEITFFMDKANEYKVIITCGSNYYGENKQQNNLGECHLTKVNTSQLSEAIDNLDELMDVVY